MTKKSLALVAAIAVMATASLASAASIKGSRHDLTTGGVNVTASPTQQVCAFCHAPHNAYQKIPLWNRSNPTNNFQLYSSSTMKNHFGSQVSALTSDSISLFCMSCHDGGALGGRIHNRTQIKDWTGVAVAGTAFTADAITGTRKSVLGSDLRDDHPINFLVNDTTGINKNSLQASLATSSPGWTSGGTKLPLFKSARGAATLECSSCHAVHDPANTPFLRLSNAGSNLCLACHDK